MSRTAGASSAGQAVIELLEGRKGFDWWWHDIREDDQREIIDAIEGVVVLKAPCALCGLTGAHRHRPHVTEMHGLLHTGQQAKLKLGGCPACAQLAPATDAPCPAFLAMSDIAQPAAFEVLSD